MVLGIKVNHLSKGFNGFTALHDISIEINQSGLYGLIGPNGAGKTTLFKCITGLLNPTKGHVLIDDQEVQPKHLSHRLKIGFLPEDAGLYDRLTARDFLHVIAAMSDINKNKRGKRVKEVVEYVGITYSPNSIIKFLSTGQRRLLLIASVLLHDPEIIILDESLNGLDPINRDKISYLMKRIASEKIVFFSSHVLSDIWRLCERIFVLSKGRLVKADTPDNIVSEFSENAFYFAVPKNVEKIEKFLASSPGILSTETKGNKVIISLEDRSAFKQLLLKTIEHYDVEAFGPFIPDLDDLFVRLVRVNE